MEQPKKKLLIVEDDLGLQRQLKWSYEDFEVFCAANRSEAIAILRSEEPDVVTLDLGLPPDPDGVSEGFAVLEEILLVKPDTKVIVASCLLLNTCCRDAWRAARQRSYHLSGFRRTCPSVVHLFM